MKKIATYSFDIFEDKGEIVLRVGKLPERSFWVHFTLLRKRIDDALGVVRKELRNIEVVQKTF